MKNEIEENHDKNGNEINWNKSILLTILVESFQHWRHIENLRQGFTMVWAAIVAGVLTFMSRTEDFWENTASISPLIFLILLTFLGLLMCLRLSEAIKPCEENITEILRKAQLEKYDPIKGWARGFTKHFRLRRLYILTYVVALIFLISLLILISQAAFKN